ncbi:DUF4194 domain-containing protein [Ruficoccus amylovorans]|uniref:DUF4194 domain-containing protein n=1 Tax=Ruficoccus amylovorans TaxID=1804625 RepID=A0A842HLC9_9BACT|nr:DUF4194 domain-containing protein [Ruficoccus amylovorans]MBC2595941.1 DUF4194 domain-containing protein [Ruficoccus amylovorans]
MSASLTLSHVIVRLVSGPLYQEETDLWNRLRIESEAVRRHYALMGLEVVIDEDAGYAYLRQAETDEEDDTSGTTPLPRLLRRTPLGFHPTLLMVLLRERLLRHDQSAEGEANLYLDAAQLADLLRPYYHASTDEKKTETQISRAIGRLQEIGILRPLPDRSETIYRVEPILRTKLPIQELEAIRDRLRAYVEDDPADSEAPDTPDDSDEVSQPEQSEPDDLTANDANNHG